MMSNKKKLIIFLSLLIPVMLISGILGFISGYNDYDFSNILANLQKDMGLAAGILINSLNVILSVVGTIVCIVMYFKVKNKVKCANSSEEAFDKAENFLDIAGSVVQIIFILVTVVGVLSVCCGVLNLDKKDEVDLTFPVMLMLFSAALIIQSIFIQKTLKQQTNLSPNLDLKVYDMRAMKTFEDQCDEAQRTFFYKSAYKSFAICTNTFTVAFMVIALATMLLGLPLTATVIMGFVVLYMNVVYILKSYKVQHPKKK